MRRRTSLLIAMALGLSACSSHAPTRGAPTTAAAPTGSPSQVSTPTGASQPSSLPTRPGVGPSHVVVVLMENKEFGQIVGNPDAPYINSLARRFGLATSSFAVSHPSLPNYLALLGGSTFGIHSDCTDCHVRASNLVDQLERSGISWKAYMEGMPSACYGGAGTGPYAKKHNPFMYFDDVAGNPARCSKVVPMTELHSDLARGALPRFAWISPGLCHDMHDCAVATGDQFLAGLLPPVLNALGPTGILFLTWDEGTTDAGCCSLAAGGHVATIVAGPLVKSGERSDVPFTHYSILRTIEQGWSLQPLGLAACACTKPLTVFFAAR